MGLSVSSLVSKILPIVSTVRERQIGQTCPNASCNGILNHRKCTGKHNKASVTPVVTILNWYFVTPGNNGYPVTHFWVHQEDGIYFESKGTHDHFRPQARRATPDRSHSRTTRTIGSPKQEDATGGDTEHCNKENKVKLGDITLRCKRFFRGKRDRKRGFLCNSAFRNTGNPFPLKPHSPQRNACYAG